MFLPNSTFVQESEFRSGSQMAMLTEKAIRVIGRREAMSILASPTRYSLVSSLLLLGLQRDIFVQPATPTASLPQGISTHTTRSLEVRAQQMTIQPLLSTSFLDKMFALIKSLTIHLDEGNFVQ
jgi:hypothetical protein